MPSDRPFLLRVSAIMPAGLLVASMGSPAATRNMLTTTQFVASKYCDKVGLTRKNLPVVKDTLRESLPTSV